MDSLCATCRPLQAADRQSPCSCGVLRPTTASLAWRALCPSPCTEILSILQGADKMLLSLGRKIIPDFSVRMSLLPHHSWKTFSCSSKIQNCLFHPSKFLVFQVTNAVTNCISFVTTGKYFRLVKKKKKRCVNIAGNRPTCRLFQCEGGKCSARERWKANRN